MNASRIIIIGGAYGSGKSEIALHLARQAAESGERVILADLDFVNPYFRSREQAGNLPETVEVISTARGYETADLPAISGQVAAAIRLDQARLIIDLGGDPVGAKVMRSFAGEARLAAADFWVVINPFRPFTAAVKQISELVKALTEAAGLPPTGIIANPNLLGETTIQQVYRGLAVVKEAARIVNLPLVALAVESTLLARHPDLKTCTPELDIFPLRRQLLPPWHAEI